MLYLAVERVPDAMIVAMERCACLLYTSQGMRTLLADEAMPTAEQVRAFLQAPDGDTALDPQQQMVAMDQMLQCMEVNFRTCCDLLRYQQMKKASAVRDMDEFLDVLYPGNTEEEQDESV